MEKNPTLDKFTIHNKLNNKIIEANITIIMQYTYTALLNEFTDDLISPIA